VLVAGLGLAGGLVLLGARLSAQPASVPAVAQPGTLVKPRPVNVILRDYAFNPTPLYLVAGETVQFNLINGGLIDHEFVLGDEQVQAAWAEANAAATPPAPLATAPPASARPATGGLRVRLASGQSGSAVYTVPAGGGLRLMCHIDDHVARGMIGEVVLLSR
jgi:uncharacterized cupredoxin-like copper-binding protein